MRSSRGYDADRGKKSRRRRSASPIENARAEKKSKIEDLIPKYHQMTPAERVKARMNLQLSQAEAKEKDKDNKHWERFNFDKTAPLDEEEPKNHDYTPDDDTSSLRNTTGSYFSYSSQLTREKRTEAAHEAAMFGAPAEHKVDEKEVPGSPKDTEKRDRTASDLLSEEMIAMQKDSWQERLRKLKAAKAAAAASSAT